jgi:hypothetical protein
MLAQPRHPAADGLLALQRLAARGFASLGGAQVRQRVDLGL